MELLDLNDCGPKNEKTYTYNLVTIEYFSKSGWTGPLKKISSQSIRDPFENIHKTSKKNNSIETDETKEFLKKTFD